MRPFNVIKWKIRSALPVKFFPVQKVKYYLHRNDIQKSCEVIMGAPHFLHNHFELFDKKVLQAIFHENSKEKWSVYCQYLMLLPDKYPQHNMLYESLLKACLFFNDINSAYYIFKRAVKNEVMSHVVLFHALKNSLDKNDKRNLNFIFSILLKNYACNRDLLFIYTLVMNDCHHDNLYQSKINAIINKIEYSNDNKIGHSHPKIEITHTRKLAMFASNFKDFYKDDLIVMKYYLPIIKEMNPGSFDIVIGKHFRNMNIKERYGLDKYNIIYDEAAITQYKYVFSDYILSKHHQLFNIQQKFITFSHGVDFIIYEEMLNECSLFISQFENSIFNHDYLIYTKKIHDKFFEKLNRMKRCELTYVGPWHLSDIYNSKEKNKTIYRRQLSEFMKINIPLDKPVICVLEGEQSNKDDLIKGINKLSEHFFVIYKEAFPDNNIEHKISSNVFLYKDTSLAPNLLKLASDFVFAEINSGTFLSSVMLGINIIPYYTTRLKYKSQTKILNIPEQDYFTFIPKEYHNTLNPKQKLLYKFKYKFNILDTDAIIEAITKEDFITWYADNLKNLQNEVFGNYHTKSSAKIMARYVMQFVQHGTLGKDATAFYLK